MISLKKLIALSVAFFVGSILLCAMLAVRVIQSQGVVFVFLVWNLFLAWIPYICSIIFVVLFRNKQNRIKKSSKFLLVLFGMIWLLTLPNSFYIITDIMHLDYLGGVNNIPLWYDSLLLFGYGFTGLILGFSSLYIVQSLLRRYLKISLVWVISIAIIVLSSFGIYIGRFLRWNSWDVLRAPAGLFYDIGSRLINPFDHPRTFLFTFSYAVCLTTLYIIIYTLIELKSDKQTDLL